MSGLGEGRKGNKPQLAHQSTFIHIYCLVYADFASSLKSALHGLVTSAPLPKVSPPEEPLPPPRDTESICGQPPTELHENQLTLRVPIPFDASVSNMLDTFCTGIDTNDTNRVILDEKIDDTESVLMPSASIVGSFSRFLTFDSTGATTPKHTRSDNTGYAHKGHGPSRCTINRWTNV